MTATGPPLLRVQDPQRGEIEIGTGQRVLVLGPSGCGKTQWVRALLGLQGLKLERVEVDGRQASTAEVRRVIGWVPDNAAALLDLSVWDNVANIPHLPAVPRADAQDALEIVGLEVMARRPAHTLTRTERRRVCLARAIAARCPLIVIDGDLDATINSLLFPLLDQAPATQSVLLLSGVAGDHAWNAHSVALMAQGRLVAQGPWAELLSSYQADVRSAALWVAAP